MYLGFLLYGHTTPLFKKDLVKYDDDQEIERGGGARDEELHLRLGDQVVRFVRDGHYGDPVRHHRHHGEHHHQQLHYKVIQYNLDNSCPDSTFYWLLRHFLLEHISYFVTEINHLVHEIG